MAFYAHGIAIISSGICMFDTVLFLTLGRFVLGFAAGLCNLIFSKSITENFPEKLASILAMMCNASICIGIFASFLMGGILPDPDDIEANKEDQMWRIIYLFPAANGVCSILILMFVFRYEPIGYLVSKNLEEECILHMHKVYRKKDPASKESID